jgi:hypothetical protein
VGYPLIRHGNLCLIYPFLSIYRFTKPGGWVEFVDLDMNVYLSDSSLSDDNPLRKWNSDIIRGTFNLIQLLEGLEAFSLALFTRALGWSVEEVHVLIASVRDAVNTRTIHSQYNM